MRSFFRVFPSVVGVTLAIVSFCRADGTPSALRQRENFDAGWRFHRGEPADLIPAGDQAKIKEAVVSSTASFLTREGELKKATDPACETPWARPDFDDADWQKLELPHDWAISGPFDQALPGETGKLAWEGVGWYRKRFTASASAAGRQTFLDIDGAMSHAVIWCNGRFAGGWPYGYASFRVDLTPFLKPGGENVLAVRLENPPYSSRWYPGAGIYRHVWLVETAPLHVAQWGGAVETLAVSAEEATLKIQTVLDNAAAADAEASIQTKIYTTGDDIYTVRPTLVTTEPVLLKTPAGARARAGVTVKLPAPKLWDLTHPNLYVAVTTVSQNGRPVDRYETTFGVRTARFTADNGFLLNGQRVPLNGVCDHHDLGAIGTAINETALRRQLSKLKEFGCNAIRTSHNPPAPELLDLCDRMGFVVMDEAFDCWKAGKKPNDYHLLWDEWHEKDLRALVRRDRNHPSVVLWSIGNEVPDQGTPAGPGIAAELTHIAHEADGGETVSRPTVAACDREGSGYNEFHKNIDVMGFNYKPWTYGKFRQGTPGQPVLGSETASCISSRGFFLFPVLFDKTPMLVDYQISDYSLIAPTWSTPPDAEFRGQEEAPFTAGEFVWTGFDYMGEPTPYADEMTAKLNYRADPKKAPAGVEEVKSPARSSYFGIVDLAGFPKERFYLYQAHWRPELPMAHITPHWTWPERVGEVTPVHVFTSGDEAELFLNGRSLGRKKKGPLEYRVHWDDVKYAPGTLKVVAYKGGKEWATDEVRTAGNAAKLVLKSEQSILPADGKSLAYVDASITDESGVLSPRAANRVKFSVAGPAEIVATDNGNAIDLEAFPSHDRRAFNGRCLVIVCGRSGATGNVTVRAEAEGLQPGEATLPMN